MENYFFASPSFTLPRGIIIRWILVFPIYLSFALCTYGNPWTTGLLTHEKVMKMFPYVKYHEIGESGDPNKFRIYYSERQAEWIGGNDPANAKSDLLLKLINLPEAYLMLTGSGIPGGIGILSKNKDQVFMSTEGFVIIICENGTIYCEKASFWNPPVVEKYQIGRNGIVKVPQPLYYIGLDQEALADFKLLAEPRDDATTSAAISKGTIVEVIGLKVEEYNKFDSERWVLIKSDQGLTGWVRPFYIDKWFANHQPGFLQLFDNDMP